MFDKIKKWFEQGLWTEGMVLNAVRKGIITMDDAKAIIGKDI